MSYEKDWTERLSGCFDDCGICCYGYWCAPCLFGSNAEKIDGSNCCLWCCLYTILADCYLCWIPHMMKRKKLREKYGLKEEPCGDCPVAVCCSPCALCQEAREMKSKGKQGGVMYNVNNGAPIVHQPGGYSNHDQSGAFYNMNNGPSQSGYYTGSANYQPQPGTIYNINYGAEMGYNPDFNPYPSAGYNNYGGGQVYQQGSYPYNV